MSRELILTFHGLGEPPGSIGKRERKVWVPVEWLAAILDATLASGVGLAFDDGNASDVEHALPELTRRGLTARFFPLTARIGTDGYLGAPQIAELSAAGMQVGIHGMHHCDWRQLKDDALQEELTVSRRTLEQITGAEIAEAACPFGSYDRRVLRALRAAGYRRVFTSDGGPCRVGSWLSPRTTVDQSRSLEHWLTLARTGAHGLPDPMRMGKRLVKRLR